MTSLFAEDELVYIGTRASEVFQFRVVSNVADPEATIKEITTERGKPKSYRRKTDELESGTVVTDAAAAAAEGGLLSKPLLEKGKEQENSADSSYFANKRRSTQFGQSLRRHGRSEGDSTGSNHVSVYKLKFLSHKQLGDEDRESINLLLPVRFETN